MSSWKDSLKADPIPWLLNGEETPVRYFTLVDLLDRSPADPEVRAARAAIPASPIIQAICRGQRQDGAWMGPDLYVPKGLSTFWRLSLLGDMGLTLFDNCEVVRPACEFMFGHQDMEGCFRRKRRNGSKPARESADVPCIQARTVRALIQSGYGDDPRTKRAIGWLVHTQRDDGAWLCSGPNPRNGCLRATIDYIRAMELYPPMKKSPATRRAAAFVTELLMQKRMGRFHVSDAWRVFEFPYFNYSLIPTLLALLRLGVPADDARLAPAIRFIQDRQGDDGIWRLDTAPRSPVDFGRAGEGSRWLTLDALRVMRAAAPA